MNDEGHVPGAPGPRKAAMVSLGRVLARLAEAPHSCELCFSVTIATPAVEAARISAWSTVARGTARRRASSFAGCATQCSAYHFNHSIQYRRLEPG